MRGILGAAGLLGLLCRSTLAIQLTLEDDESVKSAASTLAFGLMRYYTGNNTGDVPGNIPSPYFWWEAGALFGTMIDYWFLTKDESYTDVISQAMLHQVGGDRDYMPANQSRTEGNDDQGFWAMAAMSAAENRFPDPPDGQPQWLALAQAVFNEYTTRWDTTTCNGGLRWQIFTFNNGYSYKNSIANGCFFNIAARLARFTGNQTYAEWAERIFAWEQGVGLITPDYRVYDGAGADGGANCTRADTAQWTYNAGVHMHGAAMMYNITGGPAQATWKQRLDGLLGEASAAFFDGGGVMVERACEGGGGAGAGAGPCDTDQLSFKGYLARWMAAATQVAPHTFDAAAPLLRNTAAAAAAACSGSPASGFAGIPSTACGSGWAGGGFDGRAGVGQQMSGLSAVMYSLVRRPGSSSTVGGGGAGGGGSTAPVTADTGGTSRGDSGAGTAAAEEKGTVLAPIGTGDRVAAGFLTSAIALGVIGGGVFAIK